MKQSVLAVHLFVCGGDLMFRRDVSMRRCACVCVCLCLSIQHVPSSLFSFASCFPFDLSHHLAIIFPSFPSLCLLMYVYVHLFMRVCDSCSLFVYIPSFTRLRDLRWTWPWMPHPASSSFFCLSYLFVLVSFFNWRFQHTIKTGATYEKIGLKKSTERQSYIFPKKQKIFGRERKKTNSLSTEWGEGKYEEGK